MRACLLLALGAFVACGPIDGAAPSPTPINSCPDHPCAAYLPTSVGGAEAACNGGVCEVNASLDYLLVVSLPDTSYFAPGQTFALPFAHLFDRPSAQCPSGTCARLPNLGVVSGQYRPLPSAQEDVRFYVGDSVLPVHTVYRPIWQFDAKTSGEALLFGLPLSPMLADITFPLDGFQGPPNGAGARAAFRAVLPPGTYERTVTPDPPFDLAFPPDVQTVTVSEGAAPLEIVTLVNIDTTGGPNGTAVHPTFDISRADGATMVDWTAYLRDATDGRRLSNVTQLGPSNQTLTGPFTYRVHVNTHRNQTTAQNALVGAELVVVPPKDQVGVPTLVAKYLGGKIIAPPYPVILPPAMVLGSVTSSPDNIPVSADLFFRSTKLYLTSQSPSFTTNLEYAVAVTTTGPPGGGTTPADARYAVRLPRGEYEVVVVPHDQTSAKSTFTLTVDSLNDPQDGKNLALGPLSTVTGRASVADGRPLAGAEVEASPASSLARAGALPETFPRPARTVADVFGTFSLLLDPGTYDIAVRPAPGSNLPWVVSTSRVIPSGVVSLDPFSVPAPVAASLTLLDPQNNPVVRALVSVYAAPVGGSAFVEIGRALTDGAGHYAMFLAGSFTP